jgi:hypothetical protein
MVNEMLLLCPINDCSFVETQEEESGLKMLPSAFLGDLEVGHKTFGGKRNG